MSTPEQRNSNALVPAAELSIVERAIVQGDLSRLSPTDRTNYYTKVCESLGLNPYTKPFDYIVLNGKMRLYALKDCTEQLRGIHGVSLRITGRETMDGVFIVTAQATTAKGKTDESIGAVPIEKLVGEARANAMMKAETKAKRRVTLSICGLGMLDESETDSIPGAKPPTVEEIDAIEARREAESRANAGPARPAALPIHDIDSSNITGGEGVDEHTNSPPNPPPDLKRVEGFVANVIQREVTVRDKKKPVFDVTIKDELGAAGTASTFSTTLGARAKTYHDTGERVIAGMAPQEGKSHVLKSLEDADAVRADQETIS